jgi:hypothetical protein
MKIPTTGSAQIPETLFIAVAEVIVFAYLLTGKQPENISGDPQKD